MIIKDNIDNESFTKALHLIDDLITDTDKESNVGDLRVEMQENMQKYSSVFKSKDLLETGYKNIEKLLKKKFL